MNSILGAILKSDNDNAVKVLQDAVENLLGGRIIPESPLKGESQPNGKIEEAVETLKESVRVMKDQVEA